MTYHKGGLNGGNLYDNNDEITMVEIERLENSIKHLTRSNIELQEALQDEYDEEFAKAIEENKAVILKYQNNIIEMRKKIS